MILKNFIVDLSNLVEGEAWPRGYGWVIFRLLLLLRYISLFFSPSSLSSSPSMFCLMAPGPFFFSSRLVFVKMLIINFRERERERERESSGGFVGSTQQPFRNY